MTPAPGTPHPRLDAIEAFVETDPVRATLLLGEIPADEVDGRVLALRARAALFRGEPATCIELARAALADPALRSRDRAAAAAGLGAAVLYDAGDITSATELLERTIRQVDPGDADVIAGRLAQVYMFQLDLPAMDRLHEAVPPRWRSPAGELRMTSCRCVLLAFAGRTTEALDLSRPLPRIAMETTATTPIEGTEAAYLAATMRILAGAHDRALQLAESLAALDPRLVPYASMLRGEVALERGDLATAILALAGSIATVPLPPGGFRSYQASALLAAAHGLRGDGAAAGDALARVPAELRASLPILAAPIVHADALRLAIDGRRTAAVQALAQHAAWSMARRMDAAALRSLHLAIRLGAPWNQVSVVERLRVDGHVDDALLRHAMAWGGQHLDALDAAAARFEDLGLRLLAAEAWGHVAKAAARAGRADRAEAAAARCRAGAEACGATAGPTVDWLC